MLIILRGCFFQQFYFDVFLCRDRILIFERQFDFFLLIVFNSDFEGEHLLQSINVEERVQKARRLFSEGYNCAQSVLLAYADV